MCRTGEKRRSTRLRGSRAQTEALLFGTVEEVTEIVKRESLRGLLQGLKAPEVVIIKGEKGESKLPNLYMAYSRVRWY